MVKVKNIKRHSYSDEVKNRSVARVRAGETMTKIAADLSKELGWTVNLNCISNWMKAAEGEGSSEPEPRETAAPPRENKDLAKEIALLRLELDFMRRKELLLRK